MRAASRTVPQSRANLPGHIVVPADAQQARFQQEEEGEVFLHAVVDDRTHRLHGESHAVAGHVTQLGDVVAAGLLMGPCLRGR